MLLFPAIDLYGGRVVRLFKGDYAQMTVYDPDPVKIARSFAETGAKCLHTVDLEGAQKGTTPHLPIIQRILAETPLFVEVGGGIRSDEVLKAYMDAGVHRAILGTAAVEDENFLLRALHAYGDRVAVGADLADGYVAVRGWTQKSAYTTEAFFEKMQKLGVKTVICTDISKDGAMRGTNRQLYADLSARFHVQLVASGGVSTLEDIRALRRMNLYGAILGKALYEGAVSLSDALTVAHNEEETV